MPGLRSKGREVRKGSVARTCFVGPRLFLALSRLIKKDVEAALRRHPALKTIEIWRGKPAATSLRTTFSSAARERAADLQNRSALHMLNVTRGLFFCNLSSN